MTKLQIEFIDTLYKSMVDYTEKFIISVKKNPVTNYKPYLFSIFAIIDVIELLLKINYIRKNKTCILYIHTSNIKKENELEFENLYDNIRPIDNYIYFSYDKFFYQKKINTIRVYNLGIFVKLFSKLKFHKKLTLQNDFNIWYPIQNLICKLLDQNTIYIPVYSNGSGLSLVFNKYRENFKLVEIQHGSVVNYPPYSFVSEIPLVDTFYYRTPQDRLFLEQNLFAKHPVELLQIPQQEILFLPKTDRIEILYISSYEFNDFHPVFKDFLKNLPSNVYVRVRLHPRQYNIENVFINQLENINANFEIHKQPNWYDNLPINCIVISPFSSVIEEAVAFNLKSIIIDDLGKKRFDYLIQQQKSIYSNNLLKDIFIK